MDTFGLQQSVTAPTHRNGHILDVVVTRSDLPHPVVEVRPLGELSPDHSLVLFQLPLPRPPLKFINFSTQAWNNFDPGKCLRVDCVRRSSILTADWLQDTYDSTLSALLDRRAQLNCSLTSLADDTVVRCRRRRCQATREDVRAPLPSHTFYS